MVCLVYGMKTTQGGQAAFILSTQVIIVPLIRYLGWGEKLGRNIKQGIVWCFGGLTLLTLDLNLGFKLSDFWILIAAISVACFAISNSHFASKDNVRVKAMGVWQSTFAGSSVFILALLLEKPSFSPSSSLWPLIIFIVLISTVFRYLAQLKLQKKLSATITGLIFTLEPVWATIFSWFWLGEKLSLKELIACGIIFIGLYQAKRPDFKATDVAPIDN